MAHAAGCALAALCVHSTDSQGMPPYFLNAQDRELARGLLRDSIYRFQMSWRQKQRDPAGALVTTLDPGTVPKLSSHTEVLIMSCPWGAHITASAGKMEQVGLQRSQRCRNQPMGSRYTNMSVCLFPFSPDLSMETPSSLR